MNWLESILRRLDGQRAPVEPRQRSACVPLADPEQEKPSRHRAAKIAGFRAPSPRPCGCTDCKSWYQYRIRWVCEECGAMWQEEKSHGDWKIEGGQLVPDHKKFANWGEEKPKST